MSHWLDDVARQVAQGGISRRSLLRRLGASAVAGAVAAIGRRTSRVAAQVTPTRRCLIGAAPDTVFGCPTGQTCCPTVDVQGVCCPSGTICPPPGNVAGPTCGGTCPAGTVICGSGTAAVCINPTTQACENGIVFTRCTVTTCTFGTCRSLTMCGTAAFCATTVSGVGVCVNGATGTCMFGPYCTTSADCAADRVCVDAAFCCGVGVRICVQACNPAAATPASAPSGVSIPQTRPLGGAAR